MLDIGFSELLLTAVVALVVIGPKDLPVVLRHVSKWMHEVKRFYRGVKGQMHQLMDEAGLEDIRQEMSTIIDLEGKPQKAYNVADLDSLRAGQSRAAGAASPLVGEATRLSVSEGALSRSGEGAAMVSPQTTNELRLESTPAPNFTAPSSRPSPTRGEGAQASPAGANKRAVESSS